MGVASDRSLNRARCQQQLRVCRRCDHGQRGFYKNMIIERPREIGPILDAVPLQGQPTDSQVIKYLDAVTPSTESASRPQRDS